MLKTLFLSRKEKDFLQALDAARTLHTTLSWIPTCTNGMERIVEFFTTVSVIQDVYKCPAGKLSKKKQVFIEGLNKFFYNAGRQEYGWNRTQKGELCTDNNVFINMLVPYEEKFYTRSVAEHKQRKNNPKGEIDYALKETAHGKYNEYELIEKEFVNPFMQSQYKHLSKLLEEYK